MSIMYEAGKRVPPIQGSLYGPWKSHVGEDLDRSDMLHSG